MKLMALDVEVIRKLPLHAGDPYFSASPYILESVSGMISMASIEGDVVSSDENLTAKVLNTKKQELKTFFINSTHVSPLMVNKGAHEGYFSVMATSLPSKGMIIHQDYTITPPYVYAGHNIGYDLAVLHKYITGLDGAGFPKSHVIKFLNSEENLIWDTQTAEYYLSGQERIFSTLEEVCEANGVIYEKDKVVTEAFEEDPTLSRLSDDTLAWYNHCDALATFMVARLQIERAELSGMLPMLWNVMRAKAAVVRMEIEGLAVDGENLSKAVLSYGIHKEHLEIAANKIIEKQTGLPLEVININSHQFLHSYIWGGTVNVVVNDFVLDSAGKAVEYKTGPKKGTAKLKKVKKAVLLPGLGIAPEFFGMEVGCLDVSEGTLEKIFNKLLPGSDSYAVISNILKYRKVKKLHGTYLDPLQKYMHFSLDGRIHPQYNTAATATGRLSSSNPNIQNFTN